MDAINLSNVKIDNKTIEFEFLYKSHNIESDTIIFIEDLNKNRYFANIIISTNSIVFSYHSMEEFKIAKVTIKLSLYQYGQMKIKKSDSNGQKELIILNNKDEIISSKDNPYMIFNNKYKIQIKKDCIVIKSRKLGDKIKYEISKQLYGMKKYNRIFIYRFLKRPNRKYFLFNDRLLYGDDNAEELFKYVNETHLNMAKDCYFVIDKKAECVDRIKKIGKTVFFGSFKHKFMFVNSRMILSSHSSYLSNCFNPFSEKEMEIYKDIINKKFVFLTHGIIMNDVREYLNRELTSADLIITSTNKEFEYVSSNDYMYEEGMVIKTGLPRFDKLRNDTKKIILISPTWRNYEKNCEFENTDYYFSYKSLLSNKRLLNIVRENNYKIKFLLHPVFAKYKNSFEKYSNDVIEVLDSSKIRYSELFNECAIFITDYSSIHYDVAKLKKPIIYYQFDKHFFFKKHYGEGYFDYKKDGFGNVIEKEKELVNEIEKYLNNDCIIDKKYKNRIEKTFCFIDNKNCKRVWEEVLKLNKKEDLNYRFNNLH